MLIYEELTYKLRKSFFNVYNALGYGHKESVYQNALEKEFSILNIPYLREKSLNIKYRDQKVGIYRPDFVIDNKVILEIKSTEYIPVIFEKQTLQYLKSTDFKLGILVNFGAPKLTIRRLIWTER